MTIPPINDLLVPFLKCLADGQVHYKEDIVDWLAEEFQLTEEDRKVADSRGYSKFSNYVDWCHADCIQGEFIENVTERNRHGFRITARGLDELQKNSDKISRGYIVSFRKG